MYDFSTLNDFEFEKLACDILIYILKEYGQPKHVQTFKKGRDGGIDLLVSGHDTDYKIVGQVKHYIKTPYSVLINKIKTEEIKKVKKINPDNYFFITSLSLSPLNKQEIKELFQPYINSLDQILGRDDLNDIIRNNSEIEEKHYKLWFSSSIAIKKIMNYKFEGRRKQFNEENLKKRFRLFVTTPDYVQAYNSLYRNKYIIITGEPGSGKTICSDMLVYKFIKDDFDLTIIYDNIREIEDKLIDNNSKQIFFFDDFLGHTQAEISKSKSAENFMVKIISRIESSKNKYLILNTRKFILNSFVNESERLKNIKFLESESKIELKKYSYGIKRRILDNHIKESNLTESKVKILSQQAKYLCQHKNFSPRIIEHFTGRLVSKLNDKEFEKFIKENIKNPKEIWSHAYKKQISEYDRIVLNTLFSLKGDCTLNQLEASYHSRLDFEVLENNFLRPLDSFNESLINLKDGFINIYDTYSFKNNITDKKNVKFINPSLEDFMYYFVDTNIEEKNRILKSSAIIEQWFFFYDLKFPKIGEDKVKAPEFLLRYTKSLKKDDRSKFLLACFIFSNGFGEFKIIQNLLISIKSWEFLLKEDSLSNLSANLFLSQVKNNQKIIKTISKIDITFFINVLENTRNYHELMETIDLLYKNYNFSIIKNLVLNEKSELKYIVKRITILFDEIVEDAIDYLKTNNQENEHLDTIYEIEKDIEFIQHKVNSKFRYDLSFIKNNDWNYIALQNQMDPKEVTSIIPNLKKDNFNIEESEKEMLEIWLHQNEYTENEYDEYYFDEIQGDRLY